MWIKYDDTSYNTVLINTDHISLIEYNSNYIMITMTTGQSYTTTFGSSAYQKLYRFISQLDKQQSYTALLLFFARYRIFVQLDIIDMVNTYAIYMAVAVVAISESFGTEDFYYCSMCIC